MSSNNCTSRHGLHNKIGLLYTFLSVSAIAGASLSTSVNPAWIWLHYLTKPTATALLVLWILLIRAPVSMRYRNAIALGLAFAVGGDFFLMLPKDYFLAGLFCFLLTHCAYIYALCCDSVYISDIKNNQLISKFIILRTVFIIFAVFIIFVVIALLAFIGLWNNLPNSMKMPVAIYAAILAFMAGLAVNRAIIYPFKSPTPPAQHAANIAALGGVFFAISDSMLAYGRFYFETPLSPLLVLGTYYIAQWCFARSVLRSDQ
ncbi:putative membrane protein YhhN [Xenorhabdus cabanillasii]|uniref:Putative membrane protein YhhN n=1 Tax=Xenorhabdus cabanillasii TaxID=351673 RepID=A0A3D9UFG8_9GAMM|nr:lysoplasmalogenase [Xenorhabdus cabanillasii]REF28202.1 putative membrane protein YhhN [Xenorhabdus cabanillasii]